MHAAHLIEALQALRSELGLPPARVGANGSARLKAAGATLLHDVATWSELGIVHNLLKAQHFHRVITRTARYILKTQPDMVVLVDNRVLNLNLAKMLRLGGYQGKIVYYVAPVRWESLYDPRELERSLKNSRFLEQKKHCDLSILIYPVSLATYEKLEIPHAYIGHPLCELARPRLSDAQFSALTGIDLQSPQRPLIVGVMPGSRVREVEWIADTGLPQIRGVTTYAYSVLYPAVIAPAYALFENQAHAYAAAKAIGALVMSLAAVPTYLLARMLVRPLLALVAAGLALAVPFMGFTSLLMTEVAFYPLVALALYAAVLALNQPTLGHQLLFAVAIVAAVATRRQALVLVAAFVTAIVLLAVLEAARSPRGRRGSELMRTLRVYALTWVLLAGCLVLAVVAQLVRGSGIEGLFGANASAVTSGYSVSGIAGWFVDHLADLDVISGIVPLAALIVLVVRLFRARCNDRVEAAFAAAAVSFVFWMLLAVAAFAERFQPRLEERMLASLLPAVFVALVVWLDRPRRESSVTTASAALIAVLLPVLILHRDALGWSSVENAFGLWPLFRLVEAGSSIGLVATYVMVGAVLLGVLFVLLGRRFLLVLPAILLAYFVVATYDVQGRFERLSLQSSAAGLGLEREWIDDATPENASVAAFWSTENPSASWLNEFFSRKLGQRYSPADDVLDTFSEPLQPDPETGVLVDRVGRPISADYVVTSSSFRFDGTLVAADPRTWSTSTKLAVRCAS